LHLFEILLVLLIAAIVLTGLAQRFRVPYPSLLALGGFAIAFTPGIPRITIEPDLALALFVAPALLDAAYDTSVRDIKRDWFPLTGLAVGVVIASTIAVAWVARLLVPDMPLAVAVALGAIVAPTDAIAASVVLRQMAPPHRLITLLEGEGLFNDATALLIYRVALATAAAHAFQPRVLGFAFVAGVLGGIVLGIVLAKVSLYLSAKVEHLPSKIITQFIGTFAVWIIADRLGVSPVLTLVAYAITIARYAPARSSARERLPSYAVWEVVVFLLNVLAFTLIGLQLRPLVENFTFARNGYDLLFAAAIFLTVVVVRCIWVFSFTLLRRRLDPSSGLREMPAKRLAKFSVVLIWSGMRGTITIATALALPTDPAVFPYRDLVILSAFAVVLASLVIQGMTLRPLMERLDLRDDDPVGHETAMARRRAWQAAIDSLDGDTSDAAEAVRGEYRSQIDANEADDLADSLMASEHSRLRRQAVVAARRTVLAMRRSAEIGDDAFHLLEAELDIIEIGTRPE
jgi:Na+/H+ antiporter